MHPRLLLCKGHNTQKRVKIIAHLARSTRGKQPRCKPKIENVQLYCDFRDELTQCVTSIGG